MTKFYYNVCIRLVVHLKKVHVPQKIHILKIHIELFCSASLFLLVCPRQTTDFSRQIIVQVL